MIIRARGVYSAAEGSMMIRARGVLSSRGVYDDQTLPRKGSWCLGTGAYSSWWVVVE
jgi:hypothetical protein